MKPTPKGWPRIAPAVYYRDAGAMIDWLCRAFGFEVRLKVVDDDGGIKHSELTYGDGLIMVGAASSEEPPRFDTPCLSPTTAGGNTQNLMIYVDDADAHCAAARGAGARIVSEPELHDYGTDYWADRSYGAIDPEGHLWWFAQRMRGQ